MAQPPGLITKLLAVAALLLGASPLAAQILSGVLNPVPASTGPIISDLTYYETDSTIVATWTTNVSASSAITCGAKSGADNGLWPNSTSHQAVCVGLSASTGYSTYVTSGSTNSSTTTQTTNAAQTRIPISQTAFGALATASNPQDGDGMRTFVSNDSNQYANLDDGHGCTSSANGGANMQVCTVASTLTGGANINLLSAYGGYATCNGSDGPGGDCMSNKLMGVFGLNGSLHIFQYRGDPNSTLATQEIYFANWVRSDDHGSTWNSWQTTGTFNANGIPPSPLGSYPLASPNIGTLVPIRYAADDGTYGYTTSGNLIDGANAYVYLTYKEDSVSSTAQFLMRILRLDFQNQNVTRVQYWSGTCPSTASAAPAAFVNDSNWSTSIGSAVACYNAPSAQISAAEETFVPGLNRYVMLAVTYATEDAGTAPHFYNPALWTVFDGVTPVGPFTQVAQYFNGPLGFYTQSLVHSTVAGNSSTSNIAATMFYATYPTNYGTHSIPLTLLPSASGVMQQLQQYSCSPVENPISNGSTWATVSAFQHLQSVSSSGNDLCESGSTSGTAAAMFSGPPVTGDMGGTWPADQFSEQTIYSQDSSGDNCAGVRMDSSGDGYCLDAFSSGTNIILAKFTAGTGAFLANCGPYTPTQHDTIRTIIVGTTLTGYINGVEPAGCSVTDSSFSSGNPGMFLNAASAVTDIQIEQWDAGANQAATPVFSTYAVGYSGSVTLTSATSGATIYYTTNGSQPTRSSSTVSNGGSVTVTSPETLRAMAAATDYADSNPVTVSY